MNPLTNVKNIAKLSETELRLGLKGKASWHSMYDHSAWIFVGGLNFELTEGDIICVFSQYGEIVEINLVKDKDTGKSKGFCFICYEDQRSTTLAVDNLNGIKLVGRIIRVDHCGNYETPEEREKKRQKERQKRGIPDKSNNSDDDVLEVKKESNIKNESNHDNNHRRRRDKFDSDKRSSDHLETGFSGRRIKKEPEDEFRRNSRDDSYHERSYKEDRRNRDQKLRDEKTHHRNQEASRNEYQSRKYESHRSNERYERKDYSRGYKDDNRSRYKNDRYEREDNQRFKNRESDRSRDRSRDKERTYK